MRKSPAKPVRIGMTWDELGDAYSGAVPTKSQPLYAKCIASHGCKLTSWLSDWSSRIMTSHFVTARCRNRRLAERTSKYCIHRLPASDNRSEPHSTRLSTRSTARCVAEANSVCGMRSTSGADVLPGMRTRARDSADDAWMLLYLVPQK